MHKAQTAHSPSSARETRTDAILTWADTLSDTDALADVALVEHLLDRLDLRDERAGHGR